MSDAWVAALPLLGVVVGAVLQHWLSRTADSRKHLELLQSQAYVDYLRAVAKAAHAGSAEVRRSALADAADAKARIAIYAPPTVVSALANFEDASPVLDNTHSIKRFTAL